MYETFINKLRDEIARGEIIAMVGAGVSIASSNGNQLTSWIGLLENGVDYCVENLGSGYDDSWRSDKLKRIHSTKIEDLLSVASDIERILKNNDHFPHWLENVFSDLKCQDYQLIQAIIDLGIPIITTNYDYFLEQVSFYKTTTWKDGPTVESFLRQSNEYYKKHILHLHGFWDRPDTVILGVDSYNEILKDDYAQATLRAIRSLKTLLFIGFGEGITDPNFESLRKWSESISVGSKFFHYRLALTKEVDRIQSNHSHKEHIKVIPYGDKHEDLTVFLKNLRPPSINISGAVAEVKPLEYANANKRLLSLYLRKITNLDDSWNTFFSPIKFIGRDVELKALIDFAISIKPIEGKPKNILWRTVYGDHAVGKTRIAAEWLNYLANKGWATGLIDFSTFHPGEILSFEPGEQTAIVFDNADLSSDILWTFIEAINLQWNDLNFQIRILLISHIDQEPQLGNFDRTQRIKSLKQGSSVFISPLTDESDCVEILETVSLQFEESLSKERAKTLIQLTGGRPAFLGLAGAYKENWQNELRNYAKEIVKKGQILFDREGIDLVTLSALAGPVTDEIRQLIAPNTDNLIKLAELFAKPSSFVSEMIPRIEPDLLANEIIFESLHSNYTKLKRNELLQNIVGLVPETCLDRITTIWRGSLNLSTLFDLPKSINNLYGNKSGHDTARAIILEALFDAVALKFNNVPLRSPFTNLYRVRSSAFALALMRDELSPETNYTNIVDKVFHSSMPVDGIGLYIQEIHSYLPCTNNNRIIWASIIDYCLGDMLWSEKVPAGHNSLGEFSMAFLPENPAELFDLFHKHLTSENEIEKVYGALKLASWANGLKMEPIVAVNNFGVILDDLYKMVQSFEIPQIISASNALSHIVKGPNEKVDANRIGVSGSGIFLDLLDNLAYNSYAFDSVIRALVTIYQTPYHYENIFDWFKNNATIGGFGVPTTNKQIDDLTTTFVGFLDNNAIRPETKRSISNGLLKMNKWVEPMESHLDYILFSDSTSPDTKEEIIIRLFNVRKDLSLNFLHDLMQKGFSQNDLQYKYMLLAGMLNSGVLIKFKIGELGLTQKIGKINILKLIAEAKMSPDVAIEDKSESISLLNLIKDSYISHRGHYIHKLKAKDSTGRWAYYFILVEPENELAFLKDISGAGEIDLTDYGSVVASSYGEEPTQIVKDYLEEKYGFDLDKKK